MLTCSECNTWEQFVNYVKTRCSKTAFENWISPIHVIEETQEKIRLEVPNIFVQNYLLDNYKKDLCSFVPLNAQGEPALEFVISEIKRPPTQSLSPRESQTLSLENSDEPKDFELKLNSLYRFDNFIEGPSNQFVKSAAMGIASHPGRSYNPLFIHGGVGLGKTHLLHAVGHYVREHHKHLRVHCITTEAFINDLVHHLRVKSIDKMKNFYRSLDLLLVDDIQFLQNRQNFEEEFCNTFETLINLNKQIVITSDKPPSQLKLSERIIARMEWGLVAHVGIPDLETRVAILQHKAEQKGLNIPNEIAFYIADHIYGNVRQLEGAINKLTAYCRLFGKTLTENVIRDTLKELFRSPIKQKVSIESILKSVAMVFQVKLQDLKGNSRAKELVLARQVAMYLAKTLITDSLVAIGSAFGKTHSTVLYACKTIEEKIEKDETLTRQINLCKNHIAG
ncbi:chromosomal replication initiator protein DnaA [Chlamydia gallinacea]|uniref:Chromosomal replication initiator protein DnaA n=2 Tax=Chlamydia gallinacea TaxID=1457153 RepID=A0A173DZP1_9CHLA|nr:chromosomal replication initiator protein DnaA [Chlamydia gallinacea]EYE62923.1 chromosomal replication initiator protein DnaA [Bacteroides fragilis str. S6L5]ANG66400.1 chromosomal replication initiator protein DnaA [Chlamydia gallinacea 08-1274/3]AQT77405.1 chromosomal replication initiation protein DnaA [Chlamydia gallinacea]MBX6680158.1 chromosomal replication initiator protein DnaA [Chlamydia gallinacea]MBX6687672.1 chromosomal replication initiator protein DnaA [Chlamydia gallinacea]